MPDSNSWMKDSGIQANDRSVIKTGVDLIIGKWICGEAFQHVLEERYFP